MSPDNRERSSVLVQACPSYDTERPAQCARKALEHSDPDQTMVAPGKKVLLKVNMLSAKPPERAVTTHPAVVRAVAEACLERGAEVIIGDSPGGADKDMTRYWEETGFAEVSRATGVKLVDLCSEGTFRAEINGTPVAVSNVIRSVDTIVNLPKLKTHNLTMMTAAVKNMYGVLPGIQKGLMHSKRPRVDDFSRFVVELYKYVDPAITIMDAVTVMEGNGPAAGDPKDLGAIVSGRDAVAIDCVAARMMGFEVMDVPTNRIASQIGAGCVEGFEVLDEDRLTDEAGDLVLPKHLRAVRVQAWFLEHAPDWIFRLISGLIYVRPRVMEACIQCGICVENCPEKALSVTGGKVTLDDSYCIVCLRCQELCPNEAVGLKMSLLARMIWGGKRD